MTRTLWMPHDPDAVGLARLPASFVARRYGVGEPLEPSDDADLVVAPYGEPVEARRILRGLRPGIVVQALEAGVESLVPAVPSGVILCNARGVHDVAVAEWTIGAVLADLKGFATYRDDQRDNRWLPGLSDDLAGKRVLFLGYGAIAQAVEERLHAFGVTSARVARRARPGVHGVDALPGLLSETDVLIMLTPLTPDTLSLVNGEMLGRLPNGALVVNAGRGPVLDTAALLEELQEGRLRAVLDVTDPEPLPKGHPLWDAPNVLITPHVASDTHSLLARAYTLVAQQAERLSNGRPPLNVVDGAY